MSVDLGRRFHPPGREDAIYCVIGVRAGSHGAPHALLVAETLEQGALAVPLELLADRRYWLPADPAEPAGRDDEA